MNTQNIIEKFVSEYDTFVSNFTKEEMDSLGDDKTSGWCFAYYVHCRLKLSITSQYECLYDVKESIFELPFDKDGIYSCYIQHIAEFHHFILFVENDSVVLISTYGGQEGIINNKYSKNEFIKKLRDLYNCDPEITNEENLQKYKDFFGIKKLSFRVLHTDSLTSQYSYLPFENI